MLATNSEIAVGHLLAELGIAEHVADFFDHVIGNIAIHRNGLEPEGLNVQHVDRIAIDHDWLAEIDRFEERVAEAFVDAGVGNEVGLRIHVPERVDLLALSVKAARLAEAIGDEADVHAFGLGKLAQPIVVRETLVARAVGDDQLGARLFQASHQLDGVFDALARDDACRLENKDVVGFQADLLAQVAGVFVHGRRLGFEIKHVGDQRGGDAFTLGEFASRGSVDDHVFDARDAWGKGGVEDVLHRIDHEALAFPVEVVMVRDGVDAGLGDELGEGHTERQVHGDRQHILRHEQIDGELLHKPGQAGFDASPQLVELIARFWSAGMDPEAFLVEGHDLGMGKMSLGQQDGGADLGVELPRAEKGAVAEIAADARPLDGFKRDAIRATQPRGNESNIHQGGYSCAIALFESRSRIGEM